ncbi:MAG: protein O-mannosyl-transferase [Acidobacteriota bacterium]|nr:protein O-mannosyl-transferase [Acidobacteriota bacterium]
MANIASDIVARRRALSALFAALLLPLIFNSTHAQTGAMEADPGMGIGTRASARNSVQGYVTLPNGARLETRAKVKIVGSTGGTLFGFTDDNGSFFFRRLQGGTYFLTVDAGPEYQTVNETFDIFDSGIGSGMTQTVNVQLRYKESAAEKPGTVSTALVGVPKPALKLYEKALKAAHDGESEKAIEALKGAVATYPQFMLAFNEMGVQYMRVNKFDEAAEALRSALELSPDAAPPHLNYGILLFYRNNLPGAEQHLRLVLQKQEGSVLAHFFLGRTLVKERNYTEAEKELHRAITLGGTEVNEAYRYLGGIYREMGDNAHAIEALEKYLTLEPKAKDADAIREIISQLRKQTATARP